MTEPAPKRWSELAVVDSAAEGRAGALFRDVPEPEPLSPGSLARLRGRLDAESGRSRWMFPRWARRGALGLVFVGAPLAVAAIGSLPGLRALWPGPTDTAALRASKAPSPAAVPSREEDAAVSADAPPVEPVPPSRVVARPEEPRQSPARPQRGERRATTPGIAALAPQQADAPALVEAGLPAAGGEAHPLAQEAALMSRALVAARSSGTKGEALELLAEHQRRFPHGVLIGEAAVLKVEVLLALGQRLRAREALEALATRGFAGLPKAEELSVLRVELLAEEGRCRAALDAIGGLVDSEQRSVAERALFARAACRSKTGALEASRRDLADYLSRFPGGRFARQASAALEE